MTRTQRNVDRSERLLQLIGERFNGRGIYQKLEAASGISASKWKNLTYRKQEATSEQIQFWVSAYPDDRRFLLTEVQQKILQREEGFGQGYFFAVAVLLREQGPTRIVRTMLELGGDPSGADPDDLALFRLHGLTS